MKPIQLFGSTTRSVAAVFSAQERLNVFYEIVPDEEKTSKLVFRGTPGTVLSFPLPEPNVRGAIAVENLAYAYCSQHLYLLRPNLTYEIVATFGSGNSGKVSMAHNGYQLLISTGTEGFIYNTLTGLTEQITAPGWPARVSSVTFLDGFFLAAESDSVNFYKSGLFDGLAWDALEFDQATTNPDNILAIDSLRGILVISGSSSIEFWQNTAASPFPFTPLAGSALNIGLAAVYSRAFINNTMCFLGTNLGGQVQVYALDGQQAVRISDSSIENIINGFSNIADATGFGFSKDGHAFYQINFPTGNRSFRYDFMTGTWTKVQTGVVTESRHIADGAFVLNNDVFVYTSTDANIFSLDMRAKTDNGTKIKRSITSKHVEVGGDRFSVDELYLDFGLGLAPQAPAEGSSPHIIIECSKDNGNTWPLSRIVPFAKVGQYLAPRIVTYRFGQARDFVFRFTITDPIEFNLVRGCVVLRKGAE